MTSLNRRPRPLKASVKIMLLCAVVGLAFGCGEPNTYVAPPPPGVTVALPLQSDVTDYLEFTGTTQAVETVEVRARASGFLQSIHFTPGAHVRQGDLLFVIDPREYVADLDAAQAEVQSAQAKVQWAQIELERAQRLYQQRAGAEAEVVRWRGERDVSAAAVARAKARVERAQLNLDYTRVTAPISGRVSRNYVDLGNLVGEREPTLLTTITRFDPIYVYFNLNERNLLKVMSEYRKQVGEKGFNPKTAPARDIGVPLGMGLVTEEGYPHQGLLDFAESGVDAGTGTLQLRGVFPNPGGVPVILPGLFARVRMPIGERAAALMVTERAVGSDQVGRYLMVIDAENRVDKRPVRIGQVVDGLVVITEGLRPDERVVVNGIQRARPGAVVAPEETDMGSLKTSALKTALELRRSESMKDADAGSAADEGQPARRP
jgi:RND family efflux transporter MFP subunit